MIGSYKKTREEIAKIIKKSPITDDGYYVCKEFRNLNIKIGEHVDRNYIFEREYFKNKICFTENDIDAYLTKQDNKFNINEMQNLDEFLYDILKKDIDIFEIDDMIENGAFTLMELIDTSIFIYYNKFYK